MWYVMVMITVIGDDNVNDNAMYQKCDADNDDDDCL